jgi:branched-chain amino acid transport system substrate-binding protein
MRRFKVLVTFLALAAMFLSACGGSRNTTKKDPAAGPAPTPDATAKIIIGWSSSLSGGTADLGDSSKKATALALDEYKARNGKYASRIEVTYYDDEAKPDKAVQNVTRLTKDDHAIVLLGPANSGNGNATIPISTKAQIPNIVNVATGVPLTWETAADGSTIKEPPTPRQWVFRTSMSDLGQAPTMLKGLKAAGFTKAAILHDTSGYGVFGKTELERRAKDFGVTITSTQSFKAGDTDMTTQIQKAKDSGAEVIMTYTLAPELAQIFKSADKIGWYPPFYGSWTLSQPLMYKLAGKDLIAKFNINMVQSFAPENSAAAADFQKKFIAKYGSDWMPQAAAQSYDAMNLLLEIIDKVGPDSQKIRDELESHTDFKAVSKLRPMTKENHDGLLEEDMFLGQLMPDGTIVKVK